MEKMNYKLPFENSPVIKTIWVLTCMTFQIFDKPITLAMKIMVLTVPSSQAQMQGKPSPSHQIGTNRAISKKRSIQGQEGEITLAKKKPITHNIPPRGPTQDPLCVEQPPTNSMEEVCAEETVTRTKETPEEE
jgi:hypothetical protein